MYSKKLEMRALIIVYITLQISSVFEAKPSGSPIPKMPASCDGDNYCLKPSADYPLSEMKTILEHWNVTSDGGSTIGSRDGYNRILCPVNETFHEIFEIIDEHGDLRYVVQVENRFTQKYTLRPCSNEGPLTPNVLFLTEEFIAEHKLRCVNDIISPKFLVLSHDKTKLEFVTAKEGIPMECSCRYG